MADPKFPERFPDVNKKGDTIKRPQKSTETGEKPDVNKTGDTQEPNRENTRTGEMPDFHKTGE